MPGNVLAELLGKHRPAAPFRALVVDETDQGGERELTLVRDFDTVDEQGAHVRRWNAYGPPGTALPVRFSVRLDPSQDNEPIEVCCRVVADMFGRYWYLPPAPIEKSNN